MHSNFEINNCGVYGVFFYCINMIKEQCVVNILFIFNAHVTQMYLSMVSRIGSYM